MNKLLLIILVCTSTLSYSQILSEDKVLYEHKNQIVLQDGRPYEILTNKPFYDINDPTIPQHKMLTDHVLRLNRVLVLRSEGKYAELIEYIKEDFKYYEVRDLDRLKLKNTVLSGNQ
ncbi:hypothetical protein [Aquimarina brevivitae]|uniref:Uncharacterized protein n=1 Tax=Aquimarina brevivitae TaxID=323412 RepID=A0A4Q7NTZ4_9FLAO|nr:hypothetical protein [Aquimarina brevivitae]RZS90643.1 hypothetical protein EV197_3172 [Aquimarina brevivitae]